MWGGFSGGVGGKGEIIEGHGGKKKVGGMRKKIAGKKLF